MLIAALLAVPVIGFLAGLCLFRVKARWCRTCGATLTCGVCFRRVGAMLAGRP